MNSFQNMDSASGSDMATSDVPGINGLQSKVAAPGVRCTLGIAGGFDACPLGFMDEDTWDVDKNGNLSYPLCASVVEALRPVLEELRAGRDFDTRTQCKCPIKNCRLTFVVHSALLAR